MTTNERKEEILQNLIKFLQLLIDSGQHKIFYDENMNEEKAIDCINVIRELRYKVTTSIPKQVLIDKRKELDDEYSRNFGEGKDVIAQENYAFADQVLEEILSEFEEEL